MQTIVGMEPIRKIIERSQLNNSEIDDLINFLSNEEIINQLYKHVDPEHETLKCKNNMFIGEKLLSSCLYSFFGTNDIYKDVEDVSTHMTGIAAFYEDSKIIVELVKKYHKDFVDNIYMGNQVKYSENGEILSVKKYKEIIKDSFSLLVYHIINYYLSKNKAHLGVDVICDILYNQGHSDQSNGLLFAHANDTLSIHGVNMTIGPERTIYKFIKPETILNKIFGKTNLTLKEVVQIHATKTDNNYTATWNISSFDSVSKMKNQQNRSTKLIVDNEQEESRHKARYDLISNVKDEYLANLTNSLNTPVLQTNQAPPGASFTKSVLEKYLSMDRIILTDFINDEIFKRVNIDQRGCYTFERLEFDGDRCYMACVAFLLNQLTFGSLIHSVYTRFTAGSKESDYQVRLAKYLLKDSPPNYFELVTKRDTTDCKKYGDWLESMFGAIFRACMKRWKHYGIAFAVLYGFFTKITEEYPLYYDEFDVIDYANIASQFLSVPAGVNYKYTTSAPNDKFELLSKNEEQYKLFKTNGYYSSVLDSKLLLTKQQFETGIMALIDNGLMLKTGKLVKNEDDEQEAEQEEPTIETKDLDNQFVSENAGENDEEEKQEESFQVAFSEQFNSTTELAPSGNYAIDRRRTEIAGLLSKENSSVFSSVFSDESEKDRIRSSLGSIKNIHLLNPEYILWYYAYLKENNVAKKSISDFCKEYSQHKVSAATLLRYFRMFNNK